MGKQEILLLSATAVVWLMTMLGRPYIGLSYFYLYTGLFYTDIFPRFRWLRIPFVTSVLVLVSMLLTDRKKSPLPPQTWLMGALFVIMCLSRLANGLEVFGHKYMDFFWKALFLQILIVSLVDSRQKLKSFTWILVITISSLVYVARYNDVEVPYYGMNRNDFAGIIVSTAPFAIFLALSSAKKLLQLEGFGYFALLLLGVIATNSRGGYLALIVVLGLVALWNFNPRVLLVGGIVVGSVLFRVSDVHWDRLSSVRFDLEQQGTGGQRLAAWGAGANMLAANPLFGIGVGEFSDSFVKYATPKQKSRAGGDRLHQRINAHNTVVQIGAETGLLGLGVWLLLIAMSCRDIARALRLCRGDPGLRELRYLVLAIGIGFAGYFVEALFSNNAYYYQLYTFVALSVVVKRIIEHERAVAGDAPDTHGEVTFDIGGPRYLQAGLRTLLFIACTYIGMSHR
jgi:O-antigen ligase